MSVQLKREKFLEHFANRTQCLIGMEACGGVQHWARKLLELGHQVKLLPARIVKPFVGRNKSDAADGHGLVMVMGKGGVGKTTLAQTTPVLEAAYLQDDLRRAGIEPWAWIINNSLAAAHTRSPLLLQRATNERREIDAVAKIHAKRYALVPLLKDEPVGKKNLRALSQHQAATNTEADL